MNCLRFGCSKLCHDVEELIINIRLFLETEFDLIEIIKSILLRGQKVVSL